MHQAQITRLKDYYSKLMGRVSQWKEIIATWQLGTKDENNGEFRAVQDQIDNAMRKGVKLDALVELLIARRIIRPEELIEKQIELTVRLDKDLEDKFPGVKATEEGLEIDEAVFAQTKESLGFPNL